MSLSRQDCCVSLLPLPQQIKQINSRRINFCTCWRSIYGQFLKQRLNDFAFVSSESCPRHLSRINTCRLSFAQPLLTLSSLMLGPNHSIFSRQFFHWLQIYQGLFCGVYSYFFSVAVDVLQFAQNCLSSVCDTANTTSMDWSNSPWYRNSETELTGLKIKSECRD